MQTAIDLIILSNGPGEVATWVRPVVQAIRQTLRDDATPLRISLILSPCPNATGREVDIAKSIPGIDRIQSATHFFPFLLWGKTSANWDWHDRGIVLFLGGDQLFPILIGKRLGYRIVIYGEWETRWHRWGDRFAVMQSELLDRVSPHYRHKFAVIGDLMAEVSNVELRREARSEREEGTTKTQRPQSEEKEEEEEEEKKKKLTTETQRAQRQAEGGEGEKRKWGKSWDLETGNVPMIGFLPGSKPAKLAQGVPLCLAIAQCLYQVRSDLQFVIPVAPTLDLPTLARFADPAQNSIAAYFGDSSATLVETPVGAILKTKDGVEVRLWTEFPAYECLVNCDFCFTTVGANTAELGALAVPMIVLLPTQQLDAMRAWDGLPGLLANLPGIGTVFAKLINTWFLKQSRLLAWPNIWAGRSIVPELIGNLQPQAVAALALDWLEHPEKLVEIRSQLRQVRGQPGAAQKLAAIIQSEITNLK